MSEHGNETQTSTQDELVANCIRSVDDYRGQRINKWEAITRISAVIQSSTASTDIKQRTTAGGTYLAMLDEHEWLLAGARSRGYQGLGRFEFPDQEQEEDSSGANQSRNSRSRSSSPSSKRPKIDESLYAWKVQEEIAPTPLSPNLEHTRTMVQNYTTDL